MPKSRQRKKSKKKSSPKPWAVDWRVPAIRSVAHYPIHECLINAEWRESRMASIVLSRRRPDGRLAAAAFAVDLGCLGVKSAMGNGALTAVDYQRGIVERGGIEYIPCDPAFAVKLIQGAVAYAKNLGFNPDPDFNYAKELFGDIDPAPCTETIEYGDGGKPLYVAGPYDDVDKIMNHLERRLGRDHFHFLIPIGAPPEDWLDDADDESEDDDPEEAAGPRRG